MAVPKDIAVEACIVMGLAPLSGDWSIDSWFQASMMRGTERPRAILRGARKEFCGQVEQKPNHMDPSPEQFPTTRWTLVGRAGSGDGQQRPLAIEEIVRLYAPALRAHLVQSMRLKPDRADDLLQSFLTDKVLQQRLVGSADRSRGRFRTFLLTALERFVIDQHRYDAAAKRAPGGEIFDVDDQRDSLASSRAQQPADAFDLAWAREVLGEVLARMKDECAKRPELWAVFEARYLKPAAENVEPESHESLAQRLKLKSADQASNLLITAKRMFTRIFKSVVARYAADEDEARDEVRDLWEIFSRARD
jgi:RNA polymerase sigma-70 factor (ECF subfamily)